MIEISHKRELSNWNLEQLAHFVFSGLIYIVYYDAVIWHLLHIIHLMHEIIITTHRQMSESE